MAFHRHSFNTVDGYIASAISEMDLANCKKLVVWRWPTFQNSYQEHVYLVVWCSMPCLRRRSSGCGEHREKNACSENTSKVHATHATAEARSVPSARNASSTAKQADHS